MLFHGTYFSNYQEWLRNSTHAKPSAQSIWYIVSQDILNTDAGGYFQGLYTSSGFFNLWRTQGMVSNSHLKSTSLVSLFISLLLLGLAYYVTHAATSKFVPKLFTFKLLSVLAGLASLSWSGHLVHVSAPINKLSKVGIEPSLIQRPQDLLSRSLMCEVYPEFGQFSYPSLLPLQSSKTLISTLINGHYNFTGSIPIPLVASHHFYLGIVLILLGLIVSSHAPGRLIKELSSAALSPNWNLVLALNLLLLATSSFLYAHSIYSSPVYPYLSFDYLTLTSIYCHHMWIGGLFMIGYGAHAAIYLVSNLTTSQNPSFISVLLSHRDLITGHLVWVVLFLGLHSFGLYIHNDTLQALGRPEDAFSDAAIQLKPIFSTLVNYTPPYTRLSQAIGSKVVSINQSIGTADFMLNHIHAFTIHTTALVSAKGSLYARSSRLVTDKSSLGFIHPCDGPGRGGTCQISPWDHIFLRVFWMYNSVSTTLFHFFWKVQSDVWGTLTQTSGSSSVAHVTPGDFASNATSINGWLRSFLWVQATQTIQSYSTSLCAYGLMFLGFHLIWAFSLMFLFSGRGYWQELIESVLWAHQKLGVTPHIQPRALSISQGRSVGLAHYLLGGIGCTWSFFISRTTSLY